MQPFEIAGRHIGPGWPLFVIAEIGLNHGGSLDRALRLVDHAAMAGASAVKLQALWAEDLVAVDCPAPTHVRARSLTEFFAGFELHAEAYGAIAERVRAHGLALMATPFSLKAVDLLERVGVDAYKIASGDLTYDRLNAACARTGKPMVLSTGMAASDEIAHALRFVSIEGGRQVALLHCVSAYPVPRGGENLRAIATLASTFDVAVGLSDHASDTRSVAMAVALGASLYERHLVLEGDDTAIDRAVSSPPDEFAAIVRTAADAVAALGDGRKACGQAEWPNRMPSRRALRAARDLTAGHVLTATDIVALRPANGLSPVHERDLVGIALRRDLERGAPFLPDDLSATGDRCEAA